MWTPESIQLLRYDGSLSKAALSRLLGVEWITVHRWESGSSVPSGLACRALDSLRNETETYTPKQESLRK